jgi:hypothetical protein
MDTLLPFLLVAVVCTLVGWGLVRLRRRVQRRRVGSAAMSAAMTVFDQIWHPAAVDPQIEIQQSYERRAPTPAPEDDDNEDEDENNEDENKDESDSDEIKDGDETEDGDEGKGKGKTEGAGGPEKAAGTGSD